MNTKKNRYDGKAKIQAWIPRDIHEKLKAFSERAEIGMPSTTSLIAQAIQEFVAKHSPQS